jgi:predicted nucleotidyltransferase
MQPGTRVYGIALRCIMYYIFNEEMRTASIQSDLDALTEVIVNTVPVEEIYLFGSYAYGMPHKDSDLDLYVVLKDSAEMRELDAVFKIFHAIGPVKKKPVDIIANKKSRYLKLASGPTIERKITREGIKIYG